MDIQRISTHEDMTALAFAAGRLFRLADKAEDDFEQCMMMRASAICEYVLRNILQERADHDE